MNQEVTGIRNLNFHNLNKYFTFPQHVKPEVVCSQPSTGQSVRSEAHTSAPPVFLQASLQQRPLFTGKSAHHNASETNKNDKISHTKASAFLPSSPCHQLLFLFGFEFFQEVFQFIQLGTDRVDGSFLRQYRHCGCLHRQAGNRRSIHLRT